MKHLSGILAIMSMSAACHAQCLRYTVDIIQPPSCEFWNPSIGASGISETGEITGTWSPCTDVGGAYFWTGSGPIANVPVFRPYISHSASDINSAGMLVGLMSTPSHNPPDRPFVYHNGVIHDLEVIPGTTACDARAINDLGQIVGFCNNPYSKACVWENNQITSLKLPMGPNAVANAISDAGLVAGWMGNNMSTNGGSHAFLYNLKTGSVVNIGNPLPTASASEATDVNNIGNVCGRSFADCIGSVCVTRRGFFWSNGQVQEIAPLPNYPHCIPASLNDSDIVVGFSFTATGNSRAFVWRDGVTDRLETLVYPSIPNLRIDRAHSINNAGQIAAHGMIDPPFGPFVALRLNPVPPLTADITCDWRVNVQDLLAVITSWHNTSGPADINNDGIVNHHDLILVVQNWSP